MPLSPTGKTTPTVMTDMFAHIIKHLQCWQFHDQVTTFIAKMVHSDCRLLLSTSLCCSELHTNKKSCPGYFLVMHMLFHFNDVYYTR